MNRSNHDGDQEDRSSDLRSHKKTGTSRRRDAVDEVALFVWNFVPDELDMPRTNKGSQRCNGRRLRIGERCKAPSRKQ